MVLKNTIFLVLLLTTFLHTIYCQTQSTINDDYKLCTCDLTKASCDINCCCDGDCTSEIKKEFTTCIINDIITSDRVCSYDQVSFDPITRQTTTTTITSSNAFCIYKSNVVNDPYRYKSQSYDASVNLSTIIVEKSVNNTNIITGESSKSLTISSTNRSSQYPQKFSLSGNIGYEIGKPVMKAVYNDSRLLINSKPEQWWTVSGGDNCDQLLVKESIRFGVNMVAGCYLNVNLSCDQLAAKISQFIDTDDKLATFRVASFAKVNLTNINDWLNVTTKVTTTVSGTCVVTTLRKFDILFVKVGKANYLHNKIIGVRTESVKTSVSLNSPLFLTSVVNFIDATGTKLMASKLSPFMNFRLPYDFFAPLLPV